MHFIVLISIGLAGLLHLIIARAHYGHDTTHGIFLFVLGIAELLWALLFWRRPNRLPYNVGLALSGGMVIFWFLSQIWGVPFEVGLGVPLLDVSALIAAFAESIGFCALIWLEFNWPGLTWANRDLPKLLVQAVMLGLTLGLISYGVSQAVEFIFANVWSFLLY